MNTFPRNELIPTMKRLVSQVAWSGSAASRECGRGSSLGYERAIPSPLGRIVGILLAYSDRRGTFQAELIACSTNFRVTDQGKSPLAWNPASVTSLPG